MKFSSYEKYEKVYGKIANSFIWVSELILQSDIFDEIYRTGDDNIPEFKFFNGESWIFGNGFYEVESPVNNEVIARVSKPGEKQLEKTLKKVHEEGRDEIANHPGEKRIENFLQAADTMEDSFEDFLNTSKLDAGKPHHSAKGEVEATIKRLRRTTMEMRSFLGDFIPGDWSEETLESEGVIEREPYGVILAISPFNYPLFISATKVTPGLLSGNAVILKPPSADPITPLMFTRVLETSGFPANVLAILTARGSSMNSVLQDDRVRAITFTGSTSVGERIIKTAGIKSYHLELGGNDPAIVLPGADVEEASDKIKSGITSYSGQRCDAIRMVLPVAEVYEPLKKSLVEKLEHIEPENPLEKEDADMGPLIDEESAEEVEKAYEDAVRNGAEPLTGFERDGNYVSPCLLEVEKQDLSELRAFKEEIFGPLSILVKVEEADEAVKISNSTKFGLDAAVFGRDEAKIRKIARKLEVGAVFVNEYPRHGIGYYPFGGMKCSGIGREGVGYSVDQLTTTKTIVHNFRGRGVWEYT